jgi:ABC-type amino acid transport substrate-binding protein
LIKDGVELLKEAAMRRGSRPYLVLLLLVAGSLAPFAQTAPLRLVSTAWPPFTNEAGQARFALDLVEAALGRLGLASHTTIVEPAKFTGALLGPDFDGSAAAWRDAEREKVLLFSQPYLENRLVLVGRRGDDVSATTVAGLKGKRIALVEGYSYGEEIGTAGVTLVRSRGEEDSLTQLLKKAADYALMDELVVQYILANHAKEAASKLQIGSTPLVTRPLYFAVKRNFPDAQAIVTRFNDQLRGMIADRTYHRLLRVSWILADVDGDGVAEFVPRSDLSGPSEPKRAYSLFSTPQPTTTDLQTEPKRFYFGGSIYTDWARVPNKYKVEDPQRPDSARSTASIFRFTW